MDNLTAGNPRAHAVRVYYEGSSTIYEGMPVCYNYDTTDNWFGGSVSDGVVTAITTTAEGAQNEGKYIRVENPANNNLMSFAGVVKKGGWCGKTGPKVLDIYVPNGAIVPVRCDVDTTVGVTILAITVASQELGIPVQGASRPVAIAAETETGLDSTAGITLATLDPNRFVYQNLDGTALSVTTGTGDVVINEIKVTSPQTGGRFTALDVQAAVTGTPSMAGYGITLYTQTDISGIIGSQCAGVSHWTNITAGGDLTNEYYALEVGIWESGANLTSNQRISPLVLRTEIDSTNAPSDGHYMITFICDGTGDHPDGLFACNALADIAATTAATVTVSTKISFKVGAPGAENTYYIPCGTVTT